MAESHWCSMKVSLNRKAHFSCGHRYFNPDFDEAKNKSEFGLCYNEHGHGHNYTLVVSISGEISPETGMIINLKHLDPLVSGICEEFDHKFLNKDVEFFKTNIPTTENIAHYIFKKLNPLLEKHKVSLDKITLYENEDIWSEVSL